MATGQKYQVHVFNMERFTDRGNLKAFADVKIGRSLKIFGCRVVQQPNQKAWVSPPQRTWQDKSGVTKYAPIVELSGELKEAVDEAILAEWVKS
jgi:DNA-binding cell septation regulator SpoVG